jgi:hypothetical protein|tara:strand:+ start:4595 stop:4861 length:267 start_codon:yes stop_codon:yes gene_type:complete
MLNKIKTTVILAAGLFIFANEADAQTYVNGYYKSNGTYVSGYLRTSPDSSPYNNYSYPGNYNPNTSRITTGSQSSYLNNYYRSSYLDW